MIGWSNTAKLIRYKKNRTNIKKGWSGNQVGKSCKDRDGPTLYRGSWAWRTGQSNHFQIIIKKVAFSVDQLLWTARQSDRVLGTSERMWLRREQRGKGLLLHSYLWNPFIMISNLQEKVAKGRGIVKEVSEAFKAVNLEETAKQLVQVLSFWLTLFCVNGFWTAFVNLMG